MTASLVSTRRYLLAAAVIATAIAAVTGCSATGATAPEQPLVTQAPQQVATPTGGPSAQQGPTTQAASGAVGVPLPVTFSDPSTGAWFTGNVTPLQPELAADQPTLLAQAPEAGPWESVYVTRVTITVTAVSSADAALSPAQLGALKLAPRAGATVATTSTVLLGPAGCAPLPNSIRPGVGMTISACITTYTTTAVAPAPTEVPSPDGTPTVPPNVGVDMSVVFQPEGASSPIVVWATNSSIPSPTYQ